MSESLDIVTISGSFQEMGKQYGSHFKKTLPKLLDILFKFFCVDHNVDRSLLLKEAESLYMRFPTKYQIFIIEAAQAAGISIEDMKILNAMETFISLIDKHNIGNCSFVGVPKEKSKVGRVLIGRNYDYPKPFDQCVQYLSVVIFKEIDKIPTAVLTIPGQIYCPTGLNGVGVFCSLNNGMESGGREVNVNSTSILTSLLYQFPLLNNHIYFVF